MSRDREGCFCLALDGACDTADYDAYENGHAAHEQHLKPFAKQAPLKFLGAYEAEREKRGERCGYGKSKRCLRIG